MAFNSQHSFLPSTHIYNSTERLRCRKYELWPESAISRERWGMAQLHKTGTEYKALMWVVRREGGTFYNSSQVLKWWILHTCIVFIRFSTSSAASAAAAPASPAASAAPLPPRQLLPLQLPPLQLPPLRPSLPPKHLRCRYLSELCGSRLVGGNELASSVADNAFLKEGVMLGA